jgi:hypothetical protein
MLQKLNFDNSTGKYWMELTEEELALISAFTALTRLGQNNPYCDAAFNIQEAVAVLKGDDYCTDAIDTAGLAFSIVDDSCTPLVAIPAVNVAIETGI